jgi:hypothetical protein
MKNWSTTISKAVSKKLLLAQVTVVSVAFSTVSYAAPDSDAVNTEAGLISDFITKILEGDVGYMISLLMFTLGVIGFLQTKKWEVMLGCFGIGLAIIIVPDALKGFFTLAGGAA